MEKYLEQPDLRGGDTSPAFAHGIFSERVLFFVLQEFLERTIIEHIPRRDTAHPTQGR